jgi:hypothetical protein
MFKSTVTGSASTTAVATIPGAAVLTLLSDEDIPASPRNAHDYRAVAALLQTESC